MGTQESSFICEECGATFGLKKTLTKHVLEKHRDRGLAFAYAMKKPSACSMVGKDPAGVARWRKEQQKNSYIGTYDVSGTGDGDKEQCPCCGDYFLAIDLDDHLDAC